jgi:P-type E1-E2 ATPase
VVLINAGDRISADMRVSRAHGFLVDTSTLTGESVPTTPQPGETVFAGTFSVEGEAVAVVTATGRSTRLAQIAHLIGAGHRPPSPLAIELTRVVRVIAAIALAVGFLFMIVALLVGIRLADGFLFALGVTVALVPEGLLPTISLALAMARSGWLLVARWSGAWNRSRRWARPPSFAPTRPGHSRETKCQ